MEHLRPCLKCGQPPVAGPAAVGSDAQLWLIACPHCGEQTPACATIEVAAAAWNARVEPAPGLGDPSSGDAVAEDDPAPIGGLGVSIAVPA